VAQGLLKLTPGRLKRLDLALAHAQDALSLPTPVNPALVLDWLATHVHKALRAPA
jgi:DNA polymerase-3 subunit delta'